MGEVTVRALLDKGPFSMRAIARAFHVEVKLPGQEPDEDQLAWHAEARSRGCFVAVATSVDEALAAVARCRAGLVE
jgi:hypothetical protein